MIDKDERINFLVYELRTAFNTIDSLKDALDKASIAAGIYKDASSKWENVNKDLNLTIQDIKKEIRWTLKKIEKSKTKHLTKHEAIDLIYKIGTDRFWEST